MNEDLCSYARLTYWFICGNTTCFVKLNIERDEDLDIGDLLNLEILGDKMYTQQPDNTSLSSTTEVTAWLYILLNGYLIYTGSRDGGPGRGGVRL